MSGTFDDFNNFDYPVDDETDTTLYPPERDETDITLYPPETTPGRSETDTTLYPPGTTPPTSTGGNGILDKIGPYLQKFLTGKATAGEYAGLASLLYGLSGGNKPSASPGWRGKIDPNKYTYNANKVEQPAYVPYSGSSAPVMGRQNFQSSYTTGAPQSRTPDPKSGDVDLNEWEATLPGGGSDSGPDAFAQGGQAKSPRYLQGITDGMADKLATSIDGEQPAALSHGEFVIPADVVSHLGNGNSEAGANELYRMMDRVRKARTGNKKQGKRINPEKFTPGGIAGFASGGVVAFNTGNLVTTGQGAAGANPVSSESNLSEWAAPGVTDYLERGMALAKSPYQAYTGPLVAGTSPLQQQAFTAASNLGTPAAMQQGATMLQNAGTALGSMGSYTPSAVGSQFSAPAAYQASTFGNQYTGTGEYKPQTATNQFSGIAAYNPTNFNTGEFSTTAAQQYMNPYLQTSLDPQLAEARRQSEITQMGNASKLAQAGAYGGSRGALMQSEAQRNLGSNLANITGQGYNTAYNAAMQQFNADQARQMQAQQGTEQSRQFGAGQAMTGAQAAAQYGQAAQAQTAQERQFAAQQALANAQNQAQYGLAGLTATEQSKQFGAGQAMTAAQAAAQYGQLAQAQNEQSRQFGANLGMTGLQSMINAGSSLGALGAQEGTLGIANLNALANQGTTQRGIEQEGIDALYKQYEQQRLDPYKQIQFQQSLFQGLPLSTVTGSTSTTGMQDLMGAINNALGIGRTVDSAVEP